MRSTALVMALTGLLSASWSLAASAQEAESAHSVSGNLTLVSDYRFRGISQTNTDPALQGGVSYNHASGFYAGIWGSNVSWLSDTGLVSNSLELDFSAGYALETEAGVSLDFGAVSYYYPGDYAPGFLRPYTTELYAGVGYGPALLKYYYSLTNLFGYADSDGSGYLDLSLSHEFGSGWSVSGHVGNQWIEGDGNEAFEYTDWSVGVSKALPQGFAIGLSYVDTDADEPLYTNAYGEYIGDAGAVLSLSKAF